MNDIVFVIVAFAGIIGMLVALIVRHQRDVRADRNGLLEYGASRGFLQAGTHVLDVGGYPMIRGLFQGVDVMVWYTERRLSRRGDETRVFVQATVPTLDARIEVSRGGGIVSRLLGARDVLIGDAAFDAQHLVESEPPDAAAHVLTPALRGELAGFPGAFVLSARERTISLHWTWGDVRDAAVLDRALRIVVAAARPGQRPLPPHARLGGSIATMDVRKSRRLRAFLMLVGPVMLVLGVGLRPACQLLERLVDAAPEAEDDATAARRRAAERRAAADLEAAEEKSAGLESQLIDQGAKVQALEESLSREKDTSRRAKLQAELAAARQEEGNLATQLGKKVPIREKPADKPSPSTATPVCTCRSTDPLCPCL